MSLDYEGNFYLKAEPRLMLPVVGLNVLRTYPTSVYQQYVLIVYNSIIGNWYAK